MDESQESTLIDAISALMIFSKSDDLKAQGSILVAMLVLVIICYLISRDICYQNNKKG